MMIVADDAVEEDSYDVDVVVEKEAKMIRRKSVL